MLPTQSVYLKVAGNIADEIRNGHFRAGDRLYSSKELCERFEISGKTAVRVQDALAKMGLIRKVRGSGVFVNYLKNVPDLSKKQNTADLRRVVFFTHSDNQWTEAFQKGIQCRVNQLGFDLRIEFIAKSAVLQDVFKAYAARADEGYIAVSTGAGMHFATGALLFSPSVNSVLIDYITPGSSCVITDNFDGMRKLVDHAVSLGHHHFMFASNFNDSLGALNANERELAFKLVVESRSLRGMVVDSGNFADLITVLRGSNAPTAILFPQDEPALRCKKILRDAKVKPLPLVMGFDDFASCESRLEHLTTLRVDRAGMGAAAVDLLRAASNANRRNKIVRIPGELIVRQ